MADGDSVNYKGSSRRGWKKAIDSARLEELRIAGRSERQLAEHFGVSRGTIRWRLAYLAGQD